MKKTIKRVTAFLLVAIMTFSLCSCNMSELYSEEIIKRASPIPQTKQEIFEYFCKVYQKAREANVKVNYEYSPEASSPDCENSYVESAFVTLAKIMTKKNSDSVEYGNDCTALVPENKLEFKDIRSANIVDIDDPSYRSYTIFLTIWEEKNPTQDDSVFGKIYKLSPKEMILEEMKKASSFYTFGDYDSQCQVGTIRAVVLKETDELSEITLNRKVRITTQITGQGNLSPLGTVDLAFNYEVNEKYTFDWDKPKDSSKSA